MSSFRNLSIAKRLYLLNGVAAVGLILLSAITIYQTSIDLREQKNTELRHLTENAIAMVAGFHKQAEAGTMSERDAKEAAKNAVASMRYATKEYFWINDMSAVIVMHPITPELNGKDLSAYKDSNGKALFSEFAETVRVSGSGYVGYMWPRPGSDKPVHKQAYVAGFAPWGWVIGTGVYDDDLAAMVRERAVTAVVIQIILQIALFLISMTVIRSIRKPVQNLIHAMSDLSDGDTDIVVPALGRQDEVGEMSRAVEVFRKKSIENKWLAEEAAANDKAQRDLREKAKEQRLDADRKRAEEYARHAEETAARANYITDLSKEFDEMVSQILDVFNNSASQMQESAETMSRTADQTSKQTTAVSAASEEASANVQTVAAAAEELTSSIQEIARQIDESARIAREGVSDAEKANERVQGLADAAHRIGEVVGLINDIASQTNLLALNATIEAARAGEAGKGFAVVATEVKSLANQTAKATDEIAAQVSQIQNATNNAVEAIVGIGETIGKMDGIASSIAAAMEEQGASTNEIANSVQSAAAGTREVSSNIQGVTESASKTGDTADEVLSASKELSGQAAILRNAVDGFLDKIRAA